MNSGHHPNISPTNGGLVAHYRIVRKLGQGGMSIVYEAFDEKLKRPVAIKVLHPFLAEGEEYRLRFLREAEAVARLTHPNIVQIYDVANANDIDAPLYIVTELLFGETLREYGKRVNIVELPELSAMIIWEIAHALDHAHQKGIIHRDIKPENIMVCHDGQLKLMDFGIASLSSEESLTQSGTLLGSLCHLSPELIKGQKATPQSDIFSLTTVFYWLLTEKLPFNGDSPHSLLKAIVDEPHAKVQCLSAFISDDIAAIVDTGLYKEKSARFSTMIAMAEAIEASLMKMGIAIDIKQMRGVLKEPDEKRASFEAAIYEQIRRLCDLALQERDEKLVLALSCRLDAAVFEHRPQPVTTKSRLSKSLTAYISALATFIIVCIAIGYKLHNQPSVERLGDLGLVLAKQIDAAEEVSEIEQGQVVNTAPLPPLMEPVPKKEATERPKPIAQQQVAITVWPFANIFVDGKLFASDTKSLLVKLSKGAHKLTFTHRYAATVEKLITVTDIGPPMELKIELLKSKPALLRVKTDVDADIALDGGYKGSTKKSLIKPIVIQIPDKTHSQIKEVLVSQDGYEPVILEVEFVAGQTKELAIKLVSIKD